MTATLTNIDVVSHDFIFIIQISDSSGKIVFITSQEANDICPNRTIDEIVGTSSISVKGTYTVKAFVWDSWDTPNVLSNVHSFSMVIW